VGYKDTGEGENNETKLKAGVKILSFIH